MLERFVSVAVKVVTRILLYGLFLFAITPCSSKEFIRALFDFRLSSISRFMATSVKTNSSSARIYNLIYY